MGLDWGVCNSWTKVEKSSFSICKWSLKGIEVKFIVIFDNEWLNSNLALIVDIPYILWYNVLWTLPIRFALPSSHFTKTYHDLLPCFMVINNFRRCKNESINYYWLWWSSKFCGKRSNLGWLTPKVLNVFLVKATSNQPLLKTRWGDQNWKAF